MKLFPFGMRWEKFDDTKEGTPSGRLTFVFQIASGDTLILISFLKEANVRNL